LSKTASWKKYVDDYQLEDSYTNGAALGKTITAIENDLRNQYQQAGVKTVR
jgi:tripartite-type tricarboxylate transporter receptor subunit TctC